MNRRAFTAVLLAAMVLASRAGVPRDEFSVWVQADPEQPDAARLDDSAKDIVRNFDSKVLTLASSEAEARAVITVIERFELPTVKFLQDGIAEFTVVKIRVDISGMSPRVFEGRAMTWAGAADGARKNAETWIKSRFAL